MTLNVFVYRQYKHCRTYLMLPGSDHGLIFANLISGHGFGDCLYGPKNKVKLSVSRSFVPAVPFQLLCPSCAPSQPMSTRTHMESAVSAVYLQRP